MTRRCLYHPERCAARRGLCWTCYSKFRGAGVAMPPMESPGPAPWTPEQLLMAWIACLSPEVRAALHRATAPTSEAA